MCLRALPLADTAPCTRPSILATSVTLHLVEGRLSSFLTVCWYCSSCSTSQRLVLTRANTPPMQDSQRVCCQHH
jgi:hypothetical protein